jgi:hypothetical protein
VYRPADRIRGGRWPDRARRHRRRRDIGGFDIGSASKLSWEVLAYLDWRFGETTSLALGYRALGLDRRKGDAQADLIMHGPLLGLIFRF